MQIKQQGFSPGTIGTTQQPAVFYRITALWALSEALLGGVLHALHLPGTGLFVGGASVLCISLLAYYCPTRHAILKATVLVILIKGMLSPHTPPGAYLAVFIQGGLGYLLFWSKSYFKMSCLLLGVLTQLQSALQRLVVMVVMFGADIYQVADGFVDYIVKKAGMAAGDYVLYVVFVYIGLHALIGVLVGWLAGRLPQMLKEQQSQVNFQVIFPENEPRITTGKRKRNNKFYKFRPLLLISIVALLAASLYFGILSYNKAYTIFTRSILILVIWVWIIAPLLQKIVRAWSSRKQSVLATEISQVLYLMPFLKQAVRVCWGSMSHLPFPKKLIMFPVICTAYILIEQKI